MLKINFRRSFGLNARAGQQVAYIVFNNFGARALQFLKRYPPQRNADSRYVRGFGVPPRRTSEDLGARWVKRIISQARKTTLIIGNNASYAQWVQSRQLQAEIHRDWWQTEEDMIDELFPTLADEMARFLPDYIVTGGGNGLSN